MSYVTSFTPPTPPKHPPNGNYKFQLWGLIFAKLQEKVGISFYFWIIRLLNSQLALYSHVRCNPLNTPNTPVTPPKHPHMTITNFNYDGSYSPGVICHIVVKADLGRWTPSGNGAEIPWIPVCQNWQMNLLWLMDPPVNWDRCLEYHYTKLGRQTYFGRWTPQSIENRCLEYCYTKLGRQTYFGQWTPLVNWE